MPGEIVGSRLIEFATLASCVDSGKLYRSRLECKFNCSTFLPGSGSIAAEGKREERQFALSGSCPDGLLAGP